MIGQANTTGGVDHTRANGIFVMIPVMLSSAAGQVNFDVYAYKLNNTVGNSFSIAANELQAMRGLAAWITGNIINVQPSQPRQLFLVFDVPRAGSYMLSGPGIQGGISIQVQ